MNSFLKILIPVALLITISTPIIPDASAVTASDWRAGRIIDDEVFSDKNSMSVQDIQNFLNSKRPSCDTWHAAPSPTGPQPPYRCLFEYYENPTTKENNLEGRPTPAGGKSAAQIIWDAGQAYNVNPMSLLVLIQKESSLVTDTWPWPSDYRTATGYGCPDGSPCDSEYFGFYNQVTKAAYQLRRYMTYPEQYNHRVGRTSNVLYHPNAACGYTGVYMETAATAALYNYTPYQPNTAALQNMYGTGDGCSSYGNRNFWRLFNDWFGTTIYKGNDPRGSFDIVQQTPSAVRLAGWARDGNMTSPASVHVYINGEFRGSITASMNRPDVGPHGFDGTVPWTAAGNHQVCAWVVGDSLGAPNTGLGCKIVSINNDTTGSLDLIRQGPSSIRVAGWGLDRSLSGPAGVHVYVNGKFTDALSANTFRPDIGNIFPAMGNNRGFDSTVPWTAAGNHQVCAWVVGDSLGSPNSGLGCRSIFINNDPAGSFDLIQTGPGVIRLGGWGLDRSYASSASIHVYINGSFAGTINANISRGDVGPHGFDGTIPWSNSGSHQACAWVVGDNLGAPNAGLGCKRFTY